MWLAGVQDWLDTSKIALLGWPADLLKAAVAVMAGSFAGVV